MLDFIEKTYSQKFLYVLAKNIEISRNDSGAPSIILTGKAEQKADELGLENFFLSISDTSNLSSAIVVGEGS